MHSQEPLPIVPCPFHILLLVLHSPSADLQSRVGLEIVEDSPNKLDKTSPPEAVTKAMIYASITNRHLDTMVISTVEKKKIVFPLLCDL